VTLARKTGPKRASSRGTALDLVYTREYSAYGLDEGQQSRLALLGGLLAAAEFNVTAIEDPEDIERKHFLDSLSLLRVPQVSAAAQLADLGSGGGLPALILAVAMPTCRVTAVESQRKKCSFIELAGRELQLPNLVVECGRAEEYARSRGRETQDVVVSRAIASLPVVAEYSLPLLHLNGHMVAMKGAVSDQERIQAEEALAILGADALRAIRLTPFTGATNRWAYVARKTRSTPSEYPRRPGIPTKRPLGMR
jgi:16S rRNA (guanine527-N7)-methyltransferase